MLNKTIIILYSIFFVFTSYQTYILYSQVYNNQKIIYSDLQETFFSTQEVISNIIRSLEMKIEVVSKIKDRNLLIDQISDEIMTIAVLDSEKKFLYGWSMDNNLHEQVHSIDSFSLPPLKKDMGWVYFDLNSSVYTCRAIYIVQREDLSLLVITCRLVPAIRAMGLLGFGFNSFSYVDYVNNNSISSKYTQPSPYARIINSPISLEAFIQPNWAFIFLGVWQDLYPYSRAEIHSIFYILVLWGFVITIGTAILLKISLKRAKSLWITSVVFDLFCLALIVFLFQDLPATYDEINERTISFRKAETLPKEVADLIPTAIYLESLTFPNDSSFLISGFASQIYPKNTGIEMGFIFPQESILYTQVIEEVSRWETNTSVTILWHFCVGLTNSFSPVFFPFDKRNIHINIWPKEVHKNILFFPNFLNYQDVAMQGMLSIDPAVDPIGWLFTRTTYLVKTSQSYSFFGFSDLPLSFSFAVTLKRDFLSAFLSNILVLTLCMLVAFLVLFIPSDSMLNSLFATISIFVGLIFVAVTNHAALRTNIQASSFAYFEYLFISFYILILAITIDFIFRIGKPDPKYNTTLFRSICYWPILLGSFTLILAIVVI